MNFMRTQCVTLYMVFMTLLVHTAPATAAAPLPQDSSAAVILAYHRIGEDHLPDQSLTGEHFAQHVAQLANGYYNVLPLPEILDALAGNRPLPPRTVGITLEGAYASAIHDAAPLLLRNNLPFTVFYASDPIDQKDPDFATWKQLKALSKDDRVTIATLPASYNHISDQPQQEQIAALNKARQRYREEFKTEAPYLSYPFGEYSLETETLAKTQGFKAAFGLQSGTVYAGADTYALPRFSMTEPYGDLERFRLVTGALPLPVTDIEPADTALGDAPFFTGFTLPDALADQAKDLSCFISGQNETDMEVLGTRVEIRATEPLQDQTRIRLNCTLPGPVSENDEIQWRWFGLLYHRPEQPATQPDAQSANTDPVDEPPPPQE